MKEFIDENEHVKMMAMILCGFSYGSNEYLLYSIKRDEKEANLFVSRLIKSSSGYTISHYFDNGEKEVLDNVVKRVINKEEIIQLKNDGFEFIKDIELVDVNYFDIQKCYVSSIPKSLVKDLMIYYDLIRKEMFERPVAYVEEDKIKVNGGFVINVFVILFGVFILIYCISIMVGFLMK